MRHLQPKYLPAALAGGLPEGARVTIAGLPGTYIVGAPTSPKKPYDYGIRSKNYPKPK